MSKGAKTPTGPYDVMCPVCGLLCSPEKLMPAMQEAAKHLGSGEYCASVTIARPDGTRWVIRRVEPGAE